MKNLREFIITEDKASDTENQEWGIINAIKTECKKRGVITITGLGAKQIVGADKMPGRNAYGSEPYIDVLIHSKSKDIGVSCKGSAAGNDAQSDAPSAFGGGLKGILNAVPAIADLLAKRIQETFTKAGLKNGGTYPSDRVPDFFFKIPKKYIETLVIGNKAMGGPIDYMYIGPKNSLKYSMLGNALTFNGSFTSALEYASKTEAYFRLRKRDLSHNKAKDGITYLKIDFDARDSDGFPIIHRAALNGQRTSRMVVVDHISTNVAAMVIQL